MCYATDGPWVLGHLWSLSVEEQFYFFWPLALVAGFGIRKKTCWAVMIISPIARMIYARYAPGLTEYAFPAVADSLAAGCLLALHAPELRRLPGWIYRAPFAAAISLGAVASMYASHRSPLIWGIVPLTIAGAIHVLVVRRDWVLNNTAVVYVGTLSYSLYLFQQPFLAQAASPLKWSAFPINVVLAVVMALLSHYIVEQPMLRVGRQLNERMIRWQKQDVVTV